MPIKRFFDIANMNLNVYIKNIQLNMLIQSGDYNRSLYVGCSMWNKLFSFKNKILKTHSNH